MTITLHGPAGQTIELPDGTIHPDLAEAITEARTTKDAYEQLRREKNPPKNTLQQLEDEATRTFNATRDLANTQAHQWIGHLDAEARRAVAQLEDHLAAAQATAEHLARVLTTRQVAAGERPWEMNTRNVPPSDDAKRANQVAAQIQAIRDIPKATEHRK